MKSIHKILATALAAAAFGAGGASAADDVMVVYDASGSMWGQIDGVSKIEIARDVMTGLVDEWAEDINLGLVAYGHRREADCGDIETMIEPAPLSRATFLDAVNSINPLGRTPLSAAVEHAAEELAYRDNPATVVLISDGLENCQADPCALSRQLSQQGVAFTTHVVGFDLQSDEYEQLACIAENTGGIFVPASDAGELADALTQVQTVIETKPEPAPEPEPEPEPEVEEVAVKAPASVTVGSEFVVAWSPTLTGDDFLTIVPTGADEGSYEDYFYAREDTEGELTAPGDPGLYEVRYVFNATDETAGSAAVEVVEAEVTVSAPETVTAGADFDVSWTGTVNGNDFVTIVPVGADEGEYLDYVYVREDTEAELTAPGETGLYEVRYVLNEGDRTLASVPVELVETEVSVSAPETVTAGADFDVSWTGTVNGNDFVTIVPMGADDGEHLDYVYVREDTEAELTAPGETGLYEVRYVLNEGDRTLASVPVELVETEVSVSAPETVTAGADFDVSWTGTVNGNDFVTIVPVGADEGEHLDYVYVREDAEAELTAPADAGLYEVRYVLNEGDRTLASTTVELVEGEVAIAAPGPVIAEETFDVSWTDTINGNDFVTVVPAGADAGDHLDYFYVRDALEGELDAPAEPGLYEVRYVLNEGDRIMASVSLEVLPQGSALDFGAGLSAPETAAPGESIVVTWTGEAEGARVSLARVDQADFSWIEAQAASGEKATKFTMPDEAGSYEIRFLDIANGSVMGRTMVTVE